MTSLFDQGKAYIYHTDSIVRSINQDSCMTVYRPSLTVKRLQSNPLKSMQSWQIVLRWRFFVLEQEPLLFVIIKSYKPQDPEKDVKTREISVGLYWE